MKRDIEVIRQILCDLESHDFEANILQVDDPHNAYQVALMKEAGLVEAAIVEDHRGLPAQAALFRLTWAGHDFLDSSRDSMLWKKAMDHVIKPGASWTFSLLAEWLKEEARRRVFGFSQPDTTS